MPEGPADAPITVTTIGYEGTTVASFLDTLRDGGVELVIDVRAVASSRRPGFAKTRLSANVEEAGMRYVHLRALGTPAEGRAAARAGRHAEMREIFLAHLDTLAALDQLADLADIVRGGQRTCLLCFEADPAHCHRTLVATALSALVPIRVVHLHPARERD